MNNSIEHWESRESAEVVLKVRTAQIQQLYRQTWVGLAGVFIVMLSVCFVLWPVIPHWKLAVWAGLSVLLTFVRGIATSRFLRTSPAGAEIYRSARLHVVGVTTSALLWAVASIFLWPGGFPAHQMVLPLCIISLSSVAVATYSTWKPSYISFLVISTVPLALRLISENDLAHTVLGLLAFIFIAILFQTGREMHGASLQALIVGLRNEELTSIVSEEKTIVEALNVQLQLEIAERTQSQEVLLLRNQELEQLNSQLTATKHSLETSNKELELALTNVKQLSGMLPICSSCKSIRNDNGYWEQIEAYVRDRSDAEFSHGICPTCVSKLYPNYKPKTG